MHLASDRESPGTKHSLSARQTVPPLQNGDDTGDTRDHASQHHGTHLVMYVSAVPLTMLNIMGHTLYDIQWKLVHADSVKCGLLLLTDICLGPGDLLTQNMWFNLENADCLMRIADTMKQTKSLFAL